MVNTAQAGMGPAQTYCLLHSHSLVPISAPFVIGLRCRSSSKCIPGGSVAVVSCRGGSWSSGFLAGEGKVEFLGSGRGYGRCGGSGCGRSRKEVVDETGRRRSRLANVKLIGVVQASRNYPQNEDLPTAPPKGKKKPFVKPVKHGSHAKRMKQRAQRQLPPKRLKAPANGMLVDGLIPVAYVVYKARSVVLEGVSRLLKHLPIKACRWCSEVHIGKEGHEIRTCQGKHSTARHGEHLWVPGYLEDIVVPLEAFHLVDHLQKPIKHEERFNHDRIPALLELCIQAGVDLPEFPTLRRTAPIDSVVSWETVNDDRQESTFNEEDRWRGTTDKAKDRVDLDASDDSEGSSKLQAVPIEVDASSLEKHKDVKRVAVGVVEQDISCHEEDHRTQIDVTKEKVGTEDIDDLERSFEVQAVSEVEVDTIMVADDIKTVAKKTLQAWVKMRAGAAQLMKVYPVRACGYCPEVHIGRRGHKLQLCGAFKHQWRNGQHGWQDAALDDLVPPRYVWHLRDVNGPPLKNNLVKYYGQAPAVVELCIQAGAEVPERYKPRLRLDVTIPDVDELEMVA